jgi:NADH-quinone oxidoreductase subunit I
MEKLSNRSKLVVNKEMSFKERIYLPAILKGMSITLKHFFKPAATVKYPEQTRPMSSIYRGQHVLKRDEDGKERCTACGLCAVACPAEAITMVASEREKGEEHLYREEKYASTYEINMLRIVDADFGRGEFIYGKDKLVEPVDQRVDISQRQIWSYNNENA